MPAISPGRSRKTKHQKTPAQRAFPTNTFPQIKHRPLITGMTLTTLTVIGLAMKRLVKALTGTWLSLMTVSTKNCLPPADTTPTCPGVQRPRKRYGRASHLMQAPASPATIRVSSLRQERRGSARTYRQMAAARSFTPVTLSGRCAYASGPHAGRISAFPEPQGVS